jgi:hypothetical protein
MERRRKDNAETQRTLRLAEAKLKIRRARAGDVARLAELAGELGYPTTTAEMKKCEGMSVRSNVIRERAHVFYERNGYEHYKTQKSFRKQL